MSAEGLPTSSPGAPGGSVDKPDAAYSKAGAFTVPDDVGAGGRAKFPPQQPNSRSLDGDAAGTGHGDGGDGRSGEARSSSTGTGNGDHGGDPGGGGGGGRSQASTPPTDKGAAGAAAPSGAGDGDDAVSQYMAMSAEAVSTFPHSCTAAFATHPARVLRLVQLASETARLRSENSKLRDELLQMKNEFAPRTASGGAGSTAPSGAHAAPPPAAFYVPAARSSPITDQLLARLRRDNADLVHRQPPPPNAHAMLQRVANSGVRPTPSRVGCVRVSLGLTCYRGAACASWCAFHRPETAQALPASNSSRRRCARRNPTPQAASPFQRIHTALPSKPIARHHQPVAGCGSRAVHASPPPNAVPSAGAAAAAAARAVVGAAVRSAAATTCVMT